MSTVLTQPTACIYNGYRLPVLDFLDKYPYVLICKENVFQYELYCSSSPINIETDSNGAYLLVRNAPHCIKYYNQYDKTWRLTYEYTSQSRTYMSSLGIPIWSSHKIAYPNGTVYIDASNEPSALYEGHTEEDDGGIDLYSFTVGLVFGLSDDLSLIENTMFENDDYVPPVKEPIAYLYNELQLPPLPEWDNGTYRVAFITSNYLGGISLHITTNYIYRTINGNYQVGCPGYMTCSYLSTSNSWGAFKAWQSSDQWIMSVGSDYIKWTNTDILYEDGTIATPATEPEPVYE
jgi:hypothetical protein